MSTTSPPIKNIVVLMFENRSYDNVLGMLYSSPSGPTPPPGQANLNGVASGLHNYYPGPTGVTYPVWGGPNDPTTIPQTDPGEYFEDMEQQFLGLTGIPPFDPNLYPTGSPPDPLPHGPYGLMGGFVANFAAQTNTEPLGDVMHCYVPELMPVTAYLAGQFMVCDSWFSSVPTQTLANRLFSLCGQPGPGTGDHSYLDDIEYNGFNKGDNPYPVQSIFEMLDQANPPGPTGPPNWKVYFHDYSMTQKLIGYVNPYASSSTNINLAYYDWEDYPPGATAPYITGQVPTTFIEDVQAGKLPPFALIEPRYSNNYCYNNSQGPIMAPGLSPNSNHPGSSSYIFAPERNAPPIDVVDGELLLLEVYSLLRIGPQWPNALLIVTYDEGGGLYDHVAPVPGTPPGPSVPDAENGFKFNWLGGRVPTIVVSPFAPAGTQLIAPQGATFDHTSIIATVIEYLAPGATAFAGNARIANAPSINLTTGLDASGNNNPDPEELPPVAKRK